MTWLDQLLEWLDQNWRHGLLNGESAYHSRITGDVLIMISDWRHEQREITK